MIKPRLTSRSNPLGGRVISHDNHSKRALIEIFNQPKIIKVAYHNIVADSTEIQKILNRKVYREPSLSNFIEFIRHAGKFSLRKDLQDHSFGNVDQAQ